MIEPDNTTLSIVRQCELLGLNRFELVLQAGVSEQDLAIMRLLDEQYTRTPFYGFRRMKLWLAEQGHIVNHKRVRHDAHHGPRGDLSQTQTEQEK